MKEQREKIRQQYRKEKGFIKKDSSGTRKGYCRGGNSGGASTSSSGASTTVEAYANSAFYLNPTRSGFDGFFTIGRYPWFDDSGINEKYDKLTYIDVRYTTSNVTSFEDFDDAFEETESYYSQGAIDQFETVYTVPDYWHWTPELESGKSYTQLIRIHLCNADQTRYTWLRFWSNRVNLTTLPQPTLSFANNQFSISNQSSGTTRCIEFYRSNYSPYSSFLSSTERDICYNCSVRNQEWGLYQGQVRQTTDFALWDIGTYKVKLIYDPWHPYDTKTRFSNAVNSWITQMNSLISGSGVTFVRDDSTSSPDITVRTKSNYDMGSSSGYIYAGFWENFTNYDGWIVSAEIGINFETEYYDGLFQTVEGVVLEELYQACGCGGDLTTRADCLNSDFNWVGKIPNGQFTDIEKNIIQFLYKSDIYKCVGLNSEALAAAMNPSNGFVYTTSTTCNINHLEEDVTYNVRIWQANSSNHYSIVPAYSQTFTVVKIEGNVMIYVNGAWKKCQAKIHNGTSWVSVPMKVHNGSTWI